MGINREERVETFKKRQSLGAQRKTETESGAPDGATQ
jgi:hypothetical protein